MATITTLFGPAVPFGFDSGLSEFDSGLSEFDSGLPELDETLWAEMTEDDTFGQMLENWDIESPLNSHRSLATSDAAKSPGRQSHQNNNAGASSSHSPGTASLILTPTSTLPDFHGDATLFEDSGDFSTSPGSNISPSSDDYVHVSRFNSQPGGGRNMINRPPPASGSGVGTSHSHPLRAPSVAPSISATHPHWPSFTSTTTSAGGWMDPQYTGQFGQLNNPANYVSDDHALALASTESFNDDLLSQFGPFDAVGDGAFDTNLPFRPTDQAHAFAQARYTSQTPFAPQVSQPQQQRPSTRLMAHQRRPQQFETEQGMYVNATQGMPQRLAVPSSVPSHVVATHSVNGHSRSAQSQGLGAAVSPSPTFTTALTAQDPRRAPYRQPPAQRPHQPQVPRARHQQQRHLDVQLPVTVVPATRPLQPAQPGSSRTAMVPSSQNERDRRRGGRERGKRLADGTRQKSSNMRKTGACWCCVIQRDSCPDGESPCGRCMIKAQKGQAYFFECDRSKLPDLVFDFLPPSMTLMHQKQTIEDCVSDQVVRWDEGNAIDVYLTSGYGPALRWKLFEFEPRSNELLGQFQYLQDPTRGVSVRRQKYSPPFGLIKLDTSDDTHFESYMDRLLDRRHLWDFGWTCFEEETQIDDFQARLLDLMCQFYMQMPDSGDFDLRELLQKIIRMMIITYIMGHTLTIAEDTAEGVVDAVRHSWKPHDIESHISPRLANRQLKFFFCVLRNQVYENILNWQQQTLHSSGKKEATWLPAFCVMLGFAMVLEEVQRTIHIQADAKAQKGEMTPEQAETEAINACERIDARFNLLVGLFRCKYRDRKWGPNGSFGHGTPVLTDPYERDFLGQLYTLLWEKHNHLASRKDVPLASEHQCRYTSRLVARFLLPFLGEGATA